MRVDILHNYYSRKNPSGENEAVETDAKLLERAGHAVRIMYADSDQMTTRLRQSPLSFSRTVVDGGAASFADRTVSNSPDILHIHNSFPFISPAIIKLAREQGSAVVMTVHNYRLSCMAGTYYRAGSICHDCDRAESDVPGILHGCYRGSRLQSVALWSRRRSMLSELTRCDHYFALTEMHRKYLIDRIGIEEKKVSVRGNPAIESVERVVEKEDGNGRHFLYVGRLSSEKGVELLAAAWHAMGPSAPALRIIGDGPLIDLVRKLADTMPSVTYCGPKTQDEVRAEMDKARALIVPSVCYEGLPRVVVEAFSRSLPVVATVLGGLSNIVSESNGMRLEDLSPLALAGRIKNFDELPEDEVVRRGKQALEHFSSFYSAAAGIESLERGYALAERASRQSR